VVNNVILKGIAFVSNARASFKEERGQDLLEYAVLAGAIAVVAFGSFAFFNWTTYFDAFASKVCNSVDVTKIGCPTP
jgi:Flp pilus assembly pilin Flp